MPPTNRSQSNTLPLMSSTPGYPICLVPLEEGLESILEFNSYAYHTIVWYLYQ